jgi:hypothetical protein
MGLAEGRLMAERKVQCSLTDHDVDRDRSRDEKAGSQGVHSLQY